MCFLAAPTGGPTQCCLPEGSGGGAAIGATGVGPLRSMPLLPGSSHSAGHLGATAHGKIREVP